jgi:hypothetical protein
VGPPEPLHLFLMANGQDRPIVVEGRVSEHPEEICNDLPLAMLLTR